MPDDGQGEKTEEPTEHKLQEAKKKGQVFKSMEIISALQFAAMMLALAWAGEWGIRNLLSFTHNLYGQIPNLSFREGDVHRIILNVLMVAAKLVIPVLAVAFLTALLLNIAQIGFFFSAAPLTPSLQKISPIEGFKKIFSKKSLFEFIKQMIKVAVIGTVAYKVISNSMGTFKNLVAWNLRNILSFGLSLMFKLIWYVTAAYLVLAIIDYLIQKKLFMMEMKMSIKELKDEFKDTEGDPHVKAKMRQMQRQMVEQSMMQQVPNASAVITNPTHLAIAIQYEQGKMDAPVVLAKGERLIAEMIREIAEKNEVPIIENIGLARALFEACKVGQTIPGELYKAVAEVLAFVFRLKRKRELAKKRSILRMREEPQMPQTPRSRRRE
ncbi:MAG: flagellar biosynthesis protein FlhB [Candidatus Eremiobacteraeota bacterium]|nr:flagellar biosynthesis protein FlhB [Candidatus Eremiobacteraeota bacterium]